MKKPSKKDVSAKGKGNPMKSKPAPNQPKEPKQTPLKRPSAAEGLEPKPKSKAGAKTPASVWSSGLTKEEEEENHAEEHEEEQLTCDETMDPATFEVPEPTEAWQDDTEQGDKKNRSKNKKFLQMLAHNQVPEWLREQWQASEKMGPGRVAKQREIVNNALDLVNGKLQLNVNKPMFTEMKSSWESQRSLEKEKSLPKLLLMGKFGMNEDTFQQALADDQIREVVLRNGAVQYAWGSAEHAREKGKSSSSSAKDEVEGNVRDKKLFEAGLKNWKIGLFKGLSRQAVGAGSSAQLALEDGLSEKQWTQAQQQLNLAMSAFDRVVVAAKKKLQTIGVDNRSDDLWGTLSLGCYLLPDHCICFILN